VDVEYFTKWDEAMPTYTNDSATSTLFLFNHAITRFGVPKWIIASHGKYFQNHMILELATKLCFHHKHSNPYYPEDNG